jgi:glycosyltransferase involved in cell wall biosynthesis
MADIKKPLPELFHLPLESYTTRYTELMSGPEGWSAKRLAPHFDLNRIEPDDKTHVAVIQNGRVLDSVNRPLWALEQIKILLRESDGGAVFLEDFFHPGVESLMYSGRQYNLYSFCWAQSFDRFDITREMPWMRSYEAMMLSSARKTFVASPILQDLILCAFPSLTEREIPYVGLPFDVKAVRSLFDPEMEPEPIQVVFSSRFDKEKQPNFFLDVVEMMPDVKFAICTGHTELKGNDYGAVARANALLDRAKNNLTLYKGVTKAEYYSVLKNAKVQFNCSLQDWVSFTLLESLTHGCLPCYPLYRDFAHVFAKCSHFCYDPFVQESACSHIAFLLESEHTAADRKPLQDILDFHDGTYDRIAEHIRIDIANT